MTMPRQQTISVRLTRDEADELFEAARLGLVDIRNAHGHDNDRGEQIAAVEAAMKKLATAYLAAWPEEAVVEE
jgi:hypothetical protein